MKPRPPTQPNLLAEVFGGVTWSIPLICLFLYVTEITTYEIDIATISITVALLGVFAQGEKVRTPAMLVWFGLFLLWALLGSISSAYSAEVSESLVEALKLWLILFVVLNALRSRKQIHLYMYVLITTYMLFPARGAIFNLYRSGGVGGGRTAWINGFSNPNDHAGTTLIALSIAAALLVGARHKLIRGAAYASVVTLTLVILMTQSRGGFVALMWFGLFSFSGKRWMKSLGTFLFIGALALAVVPSGVWTRVSGLSRATDVTQLREVDEEGSAAQRYAIWQTAFLVIGDEPVLGVGLGAAPLAIEDYNPQQGARDAHSTYIAVLVETGFPGLALFLAFLASTIIFADRVRRKAADRLPIRSRELRFLEIGLIAYLIAGIFGTYGLIPFPYLQAGLVWSFAKTCEGELAYLERSLIVKR